jgi:hypothetical protein
MVYGLKKTIAFAVKGCYAASVRNGYVCVMFKGKIKGVIQQLYC